MHGIFTYFYVFIKGVYENRIREVEQQYGWYTGCSWCPGRDETGNRIGQTRCQKFLKPDKKASTCVAQVQQAVMKAVPEKRGQAPKAERQEASRTFRENGVICRVVKVADL